MIKCSVLRWGLGKIEVNGGAISVDQRLCRILRLLDRTKASRLTGEWMTVDRYRNLSFRITVIGNLAR
jgi:hypothetical protein